MARDPRTRHPIPLHPGPPDLPGIKSSHRLAQTTAFPEEAGYAKIRIARDNERMYAYAIRWAASTRSQQGQGQSKAVEETTHGQSSTRLCL